MLGFYNIFAVFMLALSMSPSAHAGGEAGDATQLKCETAALYPAGIPWQEADLAYGEYLGGECLGCHLGDGAGGVPGINGNDPDYFYEAMWEYCAGARENEAMISVARSLDEEQLIALAAYFAQRETE